MKTEQYRLPEGTFSCLKQKNNCYCIVDYEGEAKELAVPRQIGSFPLTAIGKKAFWRNSSLQHVILPDTIECVGEWAFSGCRALRKITISGREVSFGHHVFQKTDCLREISFTGTDGSIGRLLAAAATFLDAEYLLEPRRVGSDTWYHNLDTRILSFLNESEDNVLKDLVYCAEEDMRDKQEACLRKQAHKKVEIAFLRLICADKITSDTHEALADYLRRRTIGCVDKSAWEVVREASGEQLAYCDILVQIGGIHADNFQEALADLDEDVIELKAYLLRKRQNMAQDRVLWENLEL